MSAAPVLRNIPFDQLMALVIFGDTGLMTRAAETLGVSQPAVSNLLRRLESRFSEPLFAMDGTRKTLTPIGLELYQSVAPAMRDLMKSYDRFIRLRCTPRDQRIRVAARAEILKRIIDGIDFPGAIEFSAMSGDAVVAALRSRACDIGIVQHPVDEPDLVATELFSSPTALAIPHAMTTRGTPLSTLLSPTFFARQDFISYGPNHPFLAELSRAIGQPLLPGRIRRTCTDWNLIARLVERGEGFTILPREFASSLRSTHVYDIPDSLVMPARFRAICLGSTLQMPGIESFMSGLRRIFATKTM